MPNNPYASSQNQPSQQQQPQFIMPEQSAIQASYRAAEAEQAGRPNIFKVPPPIGKQKWEAAAINSSRSVHIWLCPPYEAGRSLDHLVHSHFFMTPSVRGIRFLCEDRDTCMVCQAHDQHKDTVSKGYYESKLRFCRRQKERLYNVIALEDEDSMKGNDGIYRPLLANFAAGGMHLAICTALKDRGVNLVHPQYGAPWRVTKHKWGPSQMNVTQEITAIEDRPLPENLWQLCSPQVLWKLHTLVAPISDDKKRSMMRELQVPGFTAVQAQVPQEYGHAAAAAHAGYPPPQVAYAAPQQQQPQQAPPQGDALMQEPPWMQSGPPQQQSNPNPYAPTANAMPARQQGQSIDDLQKQLAQASGVGTQPSDDPF